MGTDRMICTVDGCDKPHHARGLCRTHWAHRRTKDDWQPWHQPPIHGTRKRYDKGCRCDECRRRESEYRAAWRLRTGRTTTTRIEGAQP